MNPKNPPDNFKQQLKSIFKASLWFFVLVSVLSVIYEVFYDEISPFLKEHAPVFYHSLEAGRAANEGIMEGKKP